MSSGGRRTWNVGPVHRGVDNTFRPHIDPSRHSRNQDLSCYSYVKENSRQRLYQEFESAHQKRLRKTRQSSLDGSSSNITPQYGKNVIATSSTNAGSNHSNRPPTGVDLALGLNGYTDKLLSELDSDSGKVRARVPTTLQSLDDEAEQRRAAQRRSREAESEKWDSIRREVEERREKEQERERNYVHEARQQMVRENNGEIRDEITKQLDRSVANDWKYQIDFKKKRAEEAKLAEMTMAQREKQVLFDADAKDEATRLRNQRQMAESREQEKNANLETKFKKDCLTAGLHRIENAAYIEDKKAANEEEMASKEADRIDKKGKREFLEHQMAANRERDLRQQSYDNAEKMTKDWQNVGLNGAHKLQQTLDKQGNAQQDAEFRDYNNKLNHVQAREVNRRDYLFEREQRALKESAFDNSNQEKYLRKLHQQSAYQDIKEQIKEREVAAQHDKDVVQRQEQERRIESELKLKNTLDQEKLQKSREAEEYRQYLLSQMEERKQKMATENLRSNMFLHHRMLAENQKADDLDRAMKKVDVNAN